MSKVSCRVALDAACFRCEHKPRHFSSMPVSPGGVCHRCQKRPCATSTSIRRCNADPLTGEGEGAGEREEERFGYCGPLWSVLFRQLAGVGALFAISLKASLGSQPLSRLRSWSEPSYSPGWKWPKTQTRKTSRRPTGAVLCCAVL